MKRRALIGVALLVGLTTLSIGIIGWNITWLPQMPWWFGTTVVGLEITLVAMLIALLQD